MKCTNDEIEDAVIISISDIPSWRMNSCRKKSRLEFLKDKIITFIRKFK